MSLFQAGVYLGSIWGGELDGLCASERKGCGGACGQGSWGGV